VRQEQRSHARPTTQCDRDLRIAHVQRRGPAPEGDYYGAVNEKVVSENITKILYPNDQALQGKALRLQQQ
jgi:hypothetical protein